MNTSRKYKNSGKVFGLDLDSLYHTMGLYEWNNHSGQGYMDLEGKPSDSTVLFVLSQFERFNVPVFPLLNELIDHCYSKVVEVIDFWEPYALFWGLTDIVATEDWRFSVYTVGGDETNPEYLETFKLEPGQGMKAFNELMGMPGLSPVPYGLGDFIEDQLFCDGDVDTESFWHFLSDELRCEIFEVCNDDLDLVKNYFKLGAWASFMWFLSPEAQPFLYSYNQIMSATMQYGESILYEGYPYTPENYRREDRAIHSCSRCGVQSWCVESVLEVEGTVSVCEGCLNGELDTGLPYVCGTKFCKWQACPNHPNHMADQGSMNGAQRRYGQLNAMARGNDFVKQQMLADAEERRRLIK